MTPADCCGRRPRLISIDLTGSTLTFLFCARCGRQQWMRDGAQVDLNVVKDTAALRWNRKRTIVSAA